ncbi:MAG: NADH-quinone oxidoreductase subunit J family protein, partial [Acidimicrobiales bacterium]
VIVYAGAIVVLFLFVIMFLGVDRRENLVYEPLAAQRPLALVMVAIAIGGVIALGVGAHWQTGVHAVSGARVIAHHPNVYVLGKSVFTTYLFAFEATAALLVIAVIGAVVLARRPRDAAGSAGSQDALPQESDAGDHGHAQVEELAGTSRGSEP